MYQRGEPGFPVLLKGQCFPAEARGTLAVGHQASPWQPGILHGTQVAFGRQGSVKCCCRRGPYALTGRQGRVPGRGTGNVSAKGRKLELSPGCFVLFPGNVCAACRLVSADSPGSLSRGPC